MGFAFRAVADDEEAAANDCDPGVTYKLVAFALGTAIAGSPAGSTPILPNSSCRCVWFHPLGDNHGHGGNRRHRLDLRRGRRS